VASFMPLKSRSSLLDFWVSSRPTARRCEERIQMPKAGVEGPPMILCFSIRRFIRLRRMTQITQIDGPSCEKGDDCERLTF